MPDLTPLLTVLTWGYTAALLGQAVALGARFCTRRSTRLPSHAAATWCVLLPLLAALVAPLFAGLQPHVAGPLEALHRWWHEWEQAAHRIPRLHHGLHAANLLFLLAAGTCLARAAYQAGRVYAFGAALRRSMGAAQPLPSGFRLRVLPVERPLCFVAGVFCPAIYATTGLLAGLPAGERDAILAHEEAHIRSQDGLVRALLAVFFSLFPLPWAGLLLRDWNRAVEQRCDRRAAEAVGSPLLVASALLRVARLGQSPPGPRSHSVSFSDDPAEIESRIRALLAEPTVRTTSLGLLLGSLVLPSLMLLFAGSLWLDHAVEFFVRH
jgi:Zn-dependent protease with chaperone function